MNAPFSYKFYCDKLLFIDKWLLIINAITFIFSLAIFPFILSFIYKYLRVKLIVIITIILISNLITATHRCNTLLLYRTSNNFFLYKTSYKSLLKYGYFFMFIGLFCFDYSIFSYNPISYSAAILFMTVAIGLFYYIKHPIFISNDKILSMDNIFHTSNKHIDILNFLIRIPYIILLLLFLLFLWAIHLTIGLTHLIHTLKYQSSKVECISIKNKLYYSLSKNVSYNKIHKLLEDKSLINKRSIINKVSLNKISTLDNFKSLNLLEPKLNNICIWILFITSILLILFLIFTIILSVIYSVDNDIYTYKTFYFDIKLALSILKFPIITAPSIIIMDKIIKYFEEYPSELTMGSTLLIIFFFPFAEIFYIIYIINSFDKIKY